MPEPKFQRGDLVRHRAGGELAVVYAEPTTVGGEPKYELDPGLLSPNLHDVPEFLLEPVKPGVVRQGVLGPWEGE